MLLRAVVLGERRTLVLRREALAELAAGDLSGVVGGMYSGAGLTCPVLRCEFTNRCQSLPLC